MGGWLWRGVARQDEHECRANTTSRADGGGRACDRVQRRSGAAIDRTRAQARMHGAVRARRKSCRSGTPQTRNREAAPCGRRRAATESAC
eukprot:1779758-Pleurochrysis_carterae.AAC.1